MEPATLIFNHVRQHSTAGSYIGNLKKVSSDLCLELKVVIAELHQLESTGGIKVYYFRGGEILVKILHHSLISVDDGRST